MKLASKKTIIYAAACVMIAAVLLAVVLLTRGGDNDTPQVILPSPITMATATPQPETDNATEGNGVSVSTVQAVIAAMERKDTYMRSLSVFDYWSGGSTQRLVSVWAEGNKMRLLISLSDGDQKNILMRDGKMWIWYDDTSSVYESTRETESEMTDVLQGIITYEDILELDTENILDAGYEEYLGEPCVYAEYTGGTLGYVTKAYISVQSGLLTGASIYDGDQLIYSMESVAYEEEISSRDVFDIPE